MPMTLRRTWPTWQLSLFFLESITFLAWQNSLDFFTKIFRVSCDVIVDTILFSFIHRICPQSTHCQPNLACLAFNEKFSTPYILLPPFSGTIPIVLPFQFPCLNSLFQFPCLNSLLQRLVVFSMVIELRSEKEIHLGKPRTQQ